MEENTKSRNVKWKTLGEIGEIYGGISGKKKEDFKNGNKKLITYKNVYENLSLNLNVEDKVRIKENEKQRKLKYGDIIFTGSSENLKECGLSSVVAETPNEELYLNSFCFFLRLNDDNLLLPNFSKHLFRSEILRKKIIKTASGVTRFNVSKELMKKIQIPLPPLKKQAKIAAVLDKFTELTEELTEELTAREAQYDYYRNMLLSQEWIEREEGKEIEWKALEEVCKILNSKRKPITRKNRIEGTYPYYGANGIKSFVKDYIFNETLILMGEDGSVMDKNKNPVLHWIENQKIWVNNHAHVLGQLKKKYNLKYIYYFLSTIDVSKIVKGLPPKLNQSNLRKIKIPFPSLKTQQKIVNILDSFETLVNDIRQGLPREIELRQKQYEYYREKLLTF